MPLNKETKPKQINESFLHLDRCNEFYLHIVGLQSFICSSYKKVLDSKMWNYLTVYK